MLASEVPSFILGSGSPRRKELLLNAGFNFSVVAASVDESFNQSHSTPQEIASTLAHRKLLAYDSWLDHKFVLTADTLVFIDNNILGKPENKEEAIDMLNSLSGKAHNVTTSVCLGYKDYKHQFSVTTKVFFGPLNKMQIEYYINYYKPFDKAGSYGIQEWLGQIGIEKIEGSYTNVIGLPMYETFNALLTKSREWLI